MRRYLPWLLAGPAVLAAIAGSTVDRPPPTRSLSNFTTSLAGRSEGQVHNAVLAARSVDGTVIAPGATFSFNERVGSWTRDRGYRKAPVSYGGEMVIDYGGGVCQVSTTLYNAALLAGLTVTERDHHLWQPLYVGAGRDAAVAQGVADLKLVNPHPDPVTLRVIVDGQRLKASVLGAGPADARWEVVVQPVERLDGAPLVRYDRHLSGGHSQRVRPGRPGCHVRVYRLTWQGGTLVERELLSDDTYLALSPVTHVGPAR